MALQIICAIVAGAIFVMPYLRRPVWIRLACVPNNEWIIPRTQSNGSSLSPFDFDLNYFEAGSSAIIWVKYSMGHRRPNKNREIIIFFFGGPGGSFHSTCWYEIQFSPGPRRQHNFRYRNVVKQLWICKKLYAIDHNVSHKRIKRTKIKIKIN